MKKFAAWCLLLLWVPGLLYAANTAAPAAAVPFKVGTNYIPVVPAQPTSVQPGQIEVIEFFWYGCPHCFALQEYVNTWTQSKPDNVVFVRVPAPLNPAWETDARAFYTAQELGLIDKAHDAIFHAIHVDHLQLNSQASYRNFFVNQFNVTPQQFDTAWNSRRVDTDLANAKVLVQRYGVLDVPTFVVNGKWLTGGGYHLTNSQVMNAVSWLVQKEQSSLTDSLAQ